MKAIRVHGRGGPDQLSYDDAPKPQPGPGEVLAHVGATAIIATELTWDETYQTAAGDPRPLPIPGHDLAGVVTEVGPGVTEFAIGAEVYALTAFGRDGAEAEYAIALPHELAPKPQMLDMVQAAAVPLAALTAWQALFIHAHLSKGQTVLIHGGAGGVGSYAVQLAHWASARVITTASTRHHDFLRGLGADQVIDYTTTPFEEVVHDADVVFDTVGGETLARSWQAVKDGGVVVSVVSPRPADDPAQTRARFVWFIVEPSGEQLRAIGDLIDAGQIQPVVSQVFPLAEAREAWETAASGHARGKVVLRVEG
ncbi:MAG TPA: NADP-dependent oxidoreductase [Ktedonobacterales bacterium]|nr:NADP-dependent oxidoreductase [Ktedonobacterales bacterium]